MLLFLYFFQIYLYIFYFFQVNGNAVFELQLKNFVNNFGLDNEGNCCQGIKRSDNHGLCSGICQTKFRVCLKVYQEVIDLKSQCTFGEYITPVLGGNHVDFTKNQIKGFINPVKFQLESWQVKILFIFQLKFKKFRFK